MRDLVTRLTPRADIICWVQFIQLYLTSFFTARVAGSTWQGFSRLLILALQFLFSHQIAYPRVQQRNVRKQGLLLFIFWWRFSYNNDLKIREQQRWRKRRLKVNSRSFNLHHYYSNSPIFQMQANSPGVEFLRAIFKFKWKKRISSCLLTSAIKREIRHFHVVVVQ